MLTPEIQAEVKRIIAGFRQECLGVLDETARVQATLAEPPDGWREYFTRRIFTALLKYKEEVETVVQRHLTAKERT